MFCCCADSKENDRIVIPPSDPGLDERPISPLKPVEPMRQPPPLDIPTVKEHPMAEEEAKAEEPPQPAYVEPEEHGERAPKPYDFDVEVSKGEAPLGLTVDMVKVGLYISKISADTAMGTYNASAEPSKRVQVRDFITEVNGKTLPDEMLAAIRADKVLRIRFFHPVPRTLSLSKQGRALGLNLTLQKVSNVIVLSLINDGAVKEYNLDALPELQFKVNDIITDVNGVSNSADGMLEELKSAQDLRITLFGGPSS